MCENDLGALHKGLDALHLEREILAICLDDNLTPEKKYEQFLTRKYDLSLVFDVMFRNFR